MKVKLSILIILLLFVSIPPTYAKGKAVTHSHEGRKHTHILPNKSNHSHNKGNREKKSNDSRSGKGVTKSQFTRITKKNLKLLHRVEDSLYVNNYSCIKKKCGKYLKFVLYKLYFPQFALVKIVDFDSKEKYARKVSTYGTKNKSALNFGGNMYNLYISSSSDKLKFTYVSDGKEVSSIIYHKVVRNVSSLRDETENFAKGRKLTVKNIGTKSQLDHGLDRFFKNHNLGKPENYFPDWVKDSNSKRKGINGHGIVKFTIVKRDYKAFVEIKGKFNEGQLINKGKLFITIENCYKHGLLVCKIGKQEKSTVVIKPNSNVKYIIEKIVDEKLPEMNRNASSEIAALNRKNSSNSSSDYCFTSELSESDKNFCLAISKNESSYCFSSGLSEGKKNLCLGASKQDSSYCYAPGLSEANKNLCLALSQNTPSYCYASGLSNGIKNLCLGGSKHESSYCYGSGLSARNKNICLAISK